MRIVVYPHVWFGSGHKVAGGEHYLLRLLQYLHKQGHEIQIVADCEKPYEHHGMQVYPQGKVQAWQLNNNEVCEWADIIITQLNGTNVAYNKSRQHDKPLLFIAHNTVKSYVVRYAQNVHVLYNSEYVKSVVHPEWDKPNMVLTPPIDYRNFKRTTNGKYITLVNCNENKGGHVLVELAKALPQYSFLGVKGGYGEQITEDLPNLTYYGNGMNIKSVLKDTAILIQPSSFETFGQAVFEAMCCGIPVIVHPTTGLLECVGTGGQYADRNNLQDYVDKIVNLINDPKEWSEKAYNRAKELDPLPKLKEVELWMQEIIKTSK